MRARVLLIGAGVWVLFALLQLNDPDPGLWLTMYLVTAFYTLGCWRRLLPRTVAITWAVGSWCLATVLFATMAEVPPGQGLLDNEVVREMGGLGLIGLWSAILAYWSPPAA